MRLVSFRDPDALHPDVTNADVVRTETGDSAVKSGVVLADEVVDLTDPALGLPGDMAVLLGRGAEALAVAARAPSSRARRYPLAALRLLAPVPVPPKVMGIGMNYGAHVAELGRARAPGLFQQTAHVRDRDGRPHRGARRLAPGRLRG
jgi:hypothetical protein